MEDAEELLKKIANLIKNPVIHIKTDDDNNSSEPDVGINIFDFSPEYSSDAIIIEMQEIQSLYDKYFNIFPTYSDLFICFPLPIYGKIIVSKSVKNKIDELLTKINSKHKIIIRHLIAEVIVYSRENLNQNRLGTINFLKKYLRQEEMAEIFLEKIHQVRTGKANITKFKLMVRFDQEKSMVFTYPDILVDNILRHFPNLVDYENTTHRSIPLPHQNTLYKEFFRSNLIIWLHLFLINETQLKPKKGKTRDPKTSSQEIEFILSIIEICDETLFNDKKGISKEEIHENRISLIKATISHPPNHLKHLLS